MRQRLRILALVTLASTTLVLGACDEKQSANAAASASATVAPPPPPPPPPEKPPIVFVEDAQITVSGEKIDLSGDVKGKLVAVLGAKPKVAGETLEIQALRDAKYARVAAAVAAVRDAKAKGAIVKTALRDNALGELPLDLGAPAACAPVGMIAKDSAILVWPAGGGTATRFTHGMAGPDMTLGSDGMRKVGASCDGNAFVVAADPEVKWGLVFDLAIAAKSSEAGAPKQTVGIVPADPPTPGKKL
jgi:hypothetical protein